MKAIDLTFPGEWACIYLNNLVEVIKRYEELNKNIERAIQKELARGDECDHQRVETLKGMKIPTHRFWAACKRYLGDQDWDYASLSKIQVPDRVYNALEAVVVDIGGHVFWYRDASGQAHRRSMAYGGTQAMTRFVASEFIGRLSTPDVGRAMINDGTAEYNDNKFFTQIVMKDGSVLVRLHYKTGPNGAKLTASDEPRSVCDRVGHVLGSIRHIFGYGGSMRMLMSDITVRQRLNMEMPDAQMTFSGGQLVINGNVHGKIVFLEHSDEAGGGLAGNLAYSEDPTEEGTPAVLITRDVLTPCKRTGRMFPIMQEGEVYRYSAPTGVAYLLTFEEPEKESRFRIGLRKSLAWLILSVRGFFLKLAFKRQREEQQRVREADTRVSLAQESSRKSEERLRRVTNPPNDILHAQFMASIEDPDDPAGFPDQDLESAVLFLDMVGFTKATKSGVKFISKARAFTDLVREIAFRHGAFTLKAMGDGIMITFAKGYEGDLRNLTMSDLIKQAIKAAIEIREQVCSNIHMPGSKNEFVKLRLGINAGWTEFGMINYVPDVIGSTVNFAARAESAAETGQVLILAQVFQMLVTNEEAMMNSHMDSANVAIAGGMLWRHRGTIQVKTQQVDAWALLEVTNADDKAFLEESLNGSDPATTRRALLRLVGSDH